MAADLANFDWKLVRSFLAVLDAGSLTAAARQSGAQQPTLSRHVAEHIRRSRSSSWRRTS
jgi:hypothetical protein